MTEQIDSRDTTKITAMLVDDEAHARQALRRALNAHPYIEILAEAENGFEAVKAVQELQPQLLFLDIQMPKLDGFDVLELLGDQAPTTLFVTAYDDYALKAFEADAVDYLLKPVNPERLTKSMEKVRSQIGMGVGRSGNDSTNQNSANLTPDTLAQITVAARPQEYSKRILVRDRSDVQVIACSDILYLESADDYVAIHTEQETHIKLDRLNALEQRLNPRQFCRIHRSVILNIDYLARIESETKDLRKAVLSGGQQLPISRAGYGALRKLL